MSFLSHSLLSISKICKKINSKISCGKTNSSGEPQITLPEELCCQFSLAELKAATHNFHKSMLIGVGDWGPVYRGIINGGTLSVAIKRWRPTSLRALLELRCGTLMLCQLRHPNIVSLVGFCQEKGEVIHVFEYASNGTLYDCLHRKAYDPLSWKKRLEICIAAARALHYLHTGARYAVIHGDVNSRSILLDDKWTSKLSNFGFSKRGPFSMSKDLISIEIKSDMAKEYYLCVAPEVLVTNRISDKTDVYSFGLVLFEVLCCRRIFEAKLDEDQQCLDGWARKCYKNGTMYNIIVPYLKGQIAPDCFKKFVEIAYDCISLEVNKRPTMGEVEIVLELVLELQKKTESEMDKMNLKGEFLYEESSFCTP